MLDLTGKRYGRLVVLEEYGKNSQNRIWVCLCDCGKNKNVRQCHLRSGASTSCGCLQKERASKAQKQHGESGTPLHNVWKAAKQRCTNPKNKRFHQYGGRGIVMHPEWMLYKNFREWCLNNGYSNGKQLDRIDNNKGYNPDNVRFVNSTTNGRNRSITATVFIGEKKIPLSTIEEIFKKHNVVIFSKRYKNREIKIRNVYNQIKAENNSVKFDCLKKNCHMEIPSEAYEEILGTCRD